MRGIQKDVLSGKDFPSMFLGLSTEKYALPIGITLQHVYTLSCSLFETSQTLIWSTFGLIELEVFELAGIKSFTRFWGMLMFGSFSVINIVVLLNLLIVMMNHSYQLIFVSGCAFM